MSEEDAVDEDDLRHAVMNALGVVGSPAAAGLRDVRRADQDANVLEVGVLEDMVTST